MKEKIERFSKGDFEYVNPSICLSESELTLTAEEKKITEGSFTISNDANQQMKGYVYSSDNHMKLVNSAFNDALNEIKYYFDAALLNAGECIKGCFHIISDCGEYALYYNIKIEHGYIQTPAGKIMDLDQFTNLARMDWAEAKRVFRTEEFEQIFLNKEESIIYRNLLKSVSTSQALEEFLITTNKKTAILLEIDKSSLEYRVGSENIADRLVITKNNWGYAEIRVSTDAAFIQLDQKYLWADRFIGNTHQVLFSIDAKQLKRGNNYGHIYIKTPLQTLTVNILCNKNGHKAIRSKLQNKAYIGLVENYLNLRQNRIELKEYLEKTQTVLKCLPGPETGHDRELVKLHLAILTGRSDLAEGLLNKLSEEAPALKQKSVIEYCVFLYLNALFSKKEETITEAAVIIRRFYDKGYNDWRMLWLLLFTDKSYEGNRASILRDIKEQFEDGCRSPILYYEAICCFNEEPALLRELSSFEIQTINYGSKNGTLNPLVVRQFTYLANKKKTFHPVIFHSLERLYKKYNSEDILSAICSMLIKGLKRSEKYYEWFRLAVLSQVKITELYEYYMYSISENYQASIAQSVMLYFIYNSNLSDRKTALLYANIVKNKADNEYIFRSYCRRMEVFTLKMLERHHISDNLAVLYKEFIGRNLPDTELSGHLPYVIFRNEITCANPNMVSVTILHKELEAEETVQLVDGKAQVDIYSDNYEIFFIDGFGNRYIRSVSYELKPYLSPEDYVEHCLDSSSNPMLILFMYNRYQKEQERSESAVILIKRVLELEGLTQSYKTECLRILTRNCYDNNNDEQLVSYLNRIDMSYISGDERVRYIDLMINCSYYDKALKAIEEFGHEGLSLNALIKLCSGWLHTFGADDKKSTLISVCYYVFTQNKYDEAILKYLVRFYRGSITAMLALWRAAKGFEVDAYKLEERLLIQMLFCENHLEDGFTVFCEYYRSISSNRLPVRAFLTYHAYRYLVHDDNIAAGMFSIMRRELFYEENEICLLAWLKKNASEDEISHNDLNFAEYSIERLVRKGIVLPFFLEYRDRLTLPDRLTGRYYITFISKPGNQVFVHYCLQGLDEEYVTEHMPDIFMGIHMKELVLFYHDEVRYYITEESPEGVFTSAEYSIRYVCNVTDEATKYNQINKMLIASEKKDDTALLGMMETYVKTEYMIGTCFRQI